MAITARKLTSLNPSWYYNTDGVPVGVTFICPGCAPVGSCSVGALWGQRSAKSGENLQSLERLSVDGTFQGSSDTCVFRMSIKNGIVR